MSKISDIDLLKELGEEIEVEKPKQYTALEARLIAGFEDILKFIEDHRRIPKHGDDNDIFERLYAVRLDQLRKSDQALSLLADMDVNGILEGDVSFIDTDMDDAELLADLGVSIDSDNKGDITNLRHVTPIAHRRAAEDIANREVCRDFDQLEPIFERVRADLESGVRKANKKTEYKDIEVGHFYIIKGQLAYIAEKKDRQKASGNNGDDYRLRVIFDNGTQSGLLMSSLQRSFYDKDNNVRIISTLESAGPLFGDVKERDNETGTIYVLRSLSTLPEIQPVRDVILKIGVTGGTVKKRIANAKKDPTYLLGEVEVVDEYTLYNINRVKLEGMLKRIFHDARLMIPIKDRFGNPYEPKEWFMVTRETVAKAVELIQSGKIKEYAYDLKKARLIKN